MILQGGTYGLVAETGVAIVVRGTNYLRLAIFDTSDTEEAKCDAGVIVSPPPHSQVCCSSVGTRFRSTCHSVQIHF